MAKKSSFDSRIKLLTPEEIAAEEKEAAEHGFTLFQYRFYKRRRAERDEKRKEALEKKWKEYRKKKELEKEREKRKKEKEKLKKQKEKELQKEKEKLKKEKKKQKMLSQPKKRKVGRPKKRGRKINYYKRKKKAAEKEYKKANPKKVSWDYKIVACHNGKQFKYIGKFVSSEKAYEKIDELLNISVVFPKRIEHRKTLFNANYEYLILEHKTDEISYLRNEYGKMVQQVTNSEKWGVLDKFSYDVEETFWVWGFNNNTDRKTFQWIYDNILLGTIQSNYDIRRVILYKNKVIFKHDDDFMDLIICKTMDDAIRFYNKLEEFIKRDKVKQVFFIGSFNQNGDKKRKLEEEIMNLTGWKKSKVQISSTYTHLRK